MSDTHNKLQYGNKYNHWKISELDLDFNYFSFSNRNLNQTHLTKHQTLSPNHQFSQRIWYVEHHSVHAHMAWSQKFRKSEISLDTGTKTVISTILFVCTTTTWISPHNANTPPHRDIKLWAREATCWTVVALHSKMLDTLSQEIFVSE